MPAPAGYQPVDNSKAPAGYAPISIQDAQGSTQPTSGAVSRFGSGLYSTTLGPIVKLFTTNPVDTVTGMLKSIVAPDDLKDIHDAATAGHYGTAALLTAKYLTSTPATRMATSMGNDVVDAAKSGDIAGAAGKVVGDVAMLAAPELADSKAAEVAGTAIKGAAKGVADTKLNYTKDVMVPALIGRMTPLGYEGGAAIGVAAKYGRGAFSGAKAALADGVSAATDTATAEASDPILNGLSTLRGKGKGFNDLTSAEQQQVRDLADQFRDAGSAQPKLAQAAPEQPVAPQAPAPPPPQPSPEDTIAQAGLFGKKYKDFASAPPKAQATITAVVEGMNPKATTETAPADIGTTQPPAPPAQQPPSVQQMMRAMPDEGARADFLRQREQAETPAKAVANGMYAQGGQTQAEAGETYEAAARTDKAVKLARALKNADRTSAELEQHPAADLVTKLAPLAKALGINAPSVKTIPEVIFHLKRLEAGGQ